MKSAHVDLAGGEARLRVRDALAPLTALGRRHGDVADLSTPIPQGDEQGTQQPRRDQDQA